MLTFSDVLALCRDSFTEKDKGTKFEKLMQRWLLADPTYTNLFTTVWMWDDFPFRSQLGGSDLGIDLVAKDDKGGYWAIQCKCYDEKTTIQKAAVDSFLANSSRFFDDGNAKIQFSGRMWISTTNRYGKNAEETFQNQTPEVVRVNINTLNESRVDWELLYKGKNGAEALRPKAEPRNHQKPIIAAALNHFANNERGTLVMACGTGKTLTSLFITQDMLQNKGFVLFLAPSIALVGQSLNSWYANSEKPIKAVCICSDSQAGSINKKDDDEADYMKEDLTELPIKSCTNADMVVREIEYYKNHDGLLVCFSTYQSIDVVHKAQEKLLAKYDNSFGSFDLVICDEAHRTASVIQSDRDEGNFTKIHNGDYISARHRLYMTATPKVYNQASKSKAALSDGDVICSMDDESIFGKHFYTLGFGTAVDKGLLTDYKVIVLTIDQSKASNEYLEAYRKFLEEYQKEHPDEEIHHITPEQQTMILGSVDALSKQLHFAHSDDFAEDEDMHRPMHTAIAFCDNVQRYSKTKTEAYVINEVALAFKNVPLTYKLAYRNDPEAQEYLSKLVEVEANYVSGDMPTNERNLKLDILREHFEPNELRTNIVCNVNCLSEGVDVPALDAAIFLAGQKSIITIIQSVGRVMRKFEGKKYGYIIIPIVVNLDADPKKELDNNERYRKVWDILNAMRSHDERLAAELSNHNYNHVKIVHSPTPPRGGKGGRGGGNGGGQVEITPEPVLFDFVDKLYARVVDEVGERMYWEKWSNKIGIIAQNFITRISDLADSGKYADDFKEFVDMLQYNINPSIDRQQAITFLAQQLVTKPLFDALFPQYDFTNNNAVSRSMQRMLDKLQGEAFVEDRHVLESFYDEVHLTCGTLRSLDEKQDTIKTLYEKFFKGAFPKTVEQLGIVYTPVECVNFIIRSVDAVLKKEFGVSLSDRGVNILDPFTGTGTFITQLLTHLRNKGISDEDLLYKYKNEIHCNEIVLLSYYIADVNIETVFNTFVHPDGDKYTPFNNICLTDTFQLAEPLNEKGQTKLQGDGFFRENSEQVEKQKQLPIRVIIGNPPYSVGQKSANDNAQNLDYPALNERIAATYAKETQSTNKNSLYDSYIKAFRWASDRILENEEKSKGGIVAFISNGSWLDGNATDGFRRCLEKEFSDIYVFNLRGNQRTSGELSRKEGGKIFGSGSRTPVTITILVNNPQKLDARRKIELRKKLCSQTNEPFIPTAEEQAILDYKKIHYLDIGDYLSREEKLNKIKDIGYVLSKKFGTATITPNAKADWINQRGGIFDELFPLQPEKKFSESEKCFFSTYSLGVVTAKDVFMYNSSKHALEGSVLNMIDFYEKQRDSIQKGNQSTIVYDSHRIVWTDSFINDLKANKSRTFDKRSICESLYRPFSKQFFCYQKDLIERTYQQTKLFPLPSMQNLLICIPSAGGTKGFSAFVVNSVVDRGFNAGTQCFPLYWYESLEDFKKRTQKEEKQLSLFDGEDQLDYSRYGFDEYGYLRHDGITDYILKEIKHRYALSSNSTAISKEDVFYYVYGLLHSPEYRSTFAADLKKSLPRIPIVDSASDFKSFVQIGRSLAELHLHYEDVKPCPEVSIVTKQEPPVSLSSAPAWFAESDDVINAAQEYFEVEKMAFAKVRNEAGKLVADKSRIIYNSRITLENIPLDAYNYVVNGKSAIEWIMERYAITTDKDSGIRNNPNDWSIEHRNPSYIFSLLQSVIALSLETNKLVAQLPALHLSEQAPEE